MTSSIVDGNAWPRMFYPSPMVGAPSVLVIDVPPDRRGRGLALDRYYAIIIETDVEREEIERYLSAARSRAVPDLLDHRSSAIWADAVVMSVLAPPAPGWPWVSVIWWPDTIAEAAVEHGVMMARRCYTMELFDTASGLDAHCVALLQGLESNYPISVRLLSADMVSGTGNV